MVGVDELLRTGGALKGALAAEAAATWVDARVPVSGERVRAFRVLREIGRGGMAIVYEAERADGEFEQRIALKWMRDRGEVAADRFRRERQILAGLRHAHVARLLDGGCTEDGITWFAMELIDGPPIDRWCIERRLGREARLVLFEQVVAAIAYAHSQLLVHGDIKPTNVLVDADGSAKLLDFGIAVHAGGAGRAAAAYTPGWASPEQRRGETIGVASDVYQLGLLLRYLLRADRSAAVAVDAAGTPPASPPDPGGADAERLPAPLRAIIELAIADDPNRRYATVEHLRADLRAWREHRPLRAMEGGAGYRAALFVRRNAWASGIGLAALLALIGGAAWFGWRLAHERDFALREAQKATATREFVVSMLRTANPDIARGQDLKVRDVLTQGEARAERELAAEPELRATMLATIADVHFSLGDWAQFERINARVVNLLERLPESRVVLALRLSEQARAIGARGETATALRWSERAAAALPDADADPQLYVRLMVARSGMLARLGRGPEAEALTRRAYDVALARLGPDDLATLGARTGVISLMFDRGEMTAALAALREHIAAMTRHPDRGPASVDTLSLRITLAQVLHANNQLEAARAEIAALLPQLERVVGPRHFRLQRPLAIDARAALDLGLIEQAATAAASAGATNSGQFGPTVRRHYILAEALLALAQGRPAETLHDLEPLFSADATDALDARTRVAARLTHARAQCALGNTDAAASALHEATLAAGLLGATDPQRRRLEVIGSSCAGFGSGAPYP